MVSKNSLNRIKLQNKADILVEEALHIPKTLQKKRKNDHQKDTIEKNNIIFGYFFAYLYLCSLKQLTDEPIVNSENLPGCEYVGFRATDAT